MRKSAQNNHKNTYLLITFLAFICIILSLVIYLQKVSNNSSINNICTALNSQSQCETVQSSSYGKIFGIDNPIFGLVGFTALMILSWMYYRTGDKLARTLTFLGIFISGMIAIWFLYIQAFILHAYCIFCVIVDIISISLMMLVIILLIKKK
jgi:uncharacterized membrane protein